MPLLATTGIRVEIKPPLLPIQNFNQYKFSPHRLPKLILAENGLSEAELLKIYSEYVEGKKIILQTKAIQKGLLREDDSIELYNNKVGRFHAKNETKFDDKDLPDTLNIIHGTPDILTANWVIDIKTCQNSDTFDRVNEKKAHRRYWWQLVGYSYLTGRKKTALVFTDLDTNRIKVYTYHILEADWKLLLEVLQEARDWLNKYHLHKLPF
jgi:hypothetical protein